MNRTERLYKIEQLLRLRRVVSLAALMDELEVSRATIKRDLEYLRERLHAPIIWDRERNGYCFASADAGQRHELPGLWFSNEELHALLAVSQILGEVEPGILHEHLQPLLQRLQGLLTNDNSATAELGRRVKFLSQGQRRVLPEHFSLVVTALLARKRLQIEAWHRGRDEWIQRELSPLRLVHYRDNWYLDAWCHLREALRSFSLETLRTVSVHNDSAIELDDAALDSHFASAYGIFAGAAPNRAVLRFTAERARWVRQEQWHPQQQGEDLADGGYRLTFPYGDSRELVMDILRHGHHVEVESPEELRQLVTNEARALLDRYG